jgi:AraC-like DNA-binding protein
LAQEKIPANSARWLAREVMRLGVPMSRALAGTGLSSLWLKDDNALVAWDHYLKIVANALDATAEPALGLKLGHDMNLGEQGAWGYAIMSSPTLGEANQVALQFWELNGALVKLSYQGTATHHQWDIRPAFPMPSRRLWIFAVEELLSTFLAAAVFLSNSGFHFSEIRLSYREPEHGALYRELFQCPILFEQGRDRFLVDSDLADRPTSLGHPQMAVFCRQHCENIRARLQGSDELIDNIRTAIITSAGQFPKLADVARCLAMSPRTLRRHLQARNLGFQQILDEVRTELAKEYLSDTSLTIDRIATRVGFTETATFRRAFKKWTGCGAAEYRKKSGF